MTVTIPIVGTAVWIDQPENGIWKLHLAQSDPRWFEITRVLGNASLGAVTLKNGKYTAVLYVGPGRGNRGRYGSLAAAKEVLQVALGVGGGM